MPSRRLMNKELAGGTDGVPVLSSSAAPFGNRCPESDSGTTPAVRQAYRAAASAVSRGTPPNVAALPPSFAGTRRAARGTPRMIRELPGIVAAAPPIVRPLPGIIRSQPGIVRALPPPWAEIRTSQTASQTPSPGPSLPLGLRSLPLAHASGSVSSALSASLWLRCPRPTSHNQGDQLDRARTHTMVILVIRPATPLWDDAGG
jgi:hypothetical protein